MTPSKEWVQRKNGRGRKEDQEGITSKVREGKKKKKKPGWKAAARSKEKKKQELIIGFINIKVISILDKRCFGRAGDGKVKKPDKSRFRRKWKEKRWRQLVQKKMFKELCFKRKQRNETLRGGWVSLQENSLYNFTNFLNLEWLWNKTFF